jgi:Na+-transporting methylmalonyl-CoA/oxaloacetate decarboxylase gamma subunit
MVVVIVVIVIIILLLIFLMWYINKPAPKEETKEEPEPEPVEEPVAEPVADSTPAPVKKTAPVLIPPPFTPPVPTQAQKTQAISLASKGTLKWYKSLVSGVPYMRDSADGTIIYLGEYTNAWDVMYAMVATGCNAYTWFSAAPDNWNNLAYGLKKDPSEIVETPTMTAVSWVYGGSAV